MRLACRCNAHRTTHGKGYPPHQVRNARAGPGPSGHRIRGGAAGRIASEPAGRGRRYWRVAEGDGSTGGLWGPEAGGGATEGVVRGTDGCIVPAKASRFVIPAEAFSLVIPAKAGIQQWQSTQALKLGTGLRSMHSGAGARKRTFLLRPACRTRREFRSTTRGCHPRSRSQSHGNETRRVPTKHLQGA